MANPSGPPTALDSLTVDGVPTMGISGLQPTSGNVFFVSSVIGSNGYTGSATAPYATIATAYAKCVANNGDTVICLAGHAETISAAGGMVFGTAGVSVVGWGEGNSRPILTFATSTAATLTMTAASNQLVNFICTTTIDQIVSPIVVSAADCMVNIEWRDGSAVIEALRAILTTAAADRLRINLTYFGFTAGTHCVNAIRLVGGDNVSITANFYGKASVGWVEFITTACTNVFINGYMYNATVTDGSKDIVDTVGGSTWYGNVEDGAAGVTLEGGSGAPFVGSDSGGADGSATTATAVIVNGNTLFTIAGGPIEILTLFSICQTANDATASTLQYQSAGTLGTTTQTISGASATLASAAIGTNVSWQGTALATAPVINANGANIVATNGGIIVPAGTIKAVVGVGSTTGTWKHYIRFRPLGAAVTVVGT